MRRRVDWSKMHGISSRQPSKTAHLLPTRLFWMQKREKLRCKEIRIMINSGDSQISAKRFPLTLYRTPTRYVQESISRYIFTLLITFRVADKKNPPKCISRRYKLNLCMRQSKWETIAQPRKGFELKLCHLEAVFSWTLLYRSTSITRAGDRELTDIVGFIDQTWIGGFFLRWNLLPGVQQLVTTRIHAWQSGRY